MGLQTNLLRREQSGDLPPYKSSDRGGVKGDQESCQQAHADGSFCGPGGRRGFRGELM